VTRAFVDWIGGKYLERIQRGLEFIGFSKMVSRSSLLFIKPNLTLPTYSPGVMTSPAAVEAALAALSDYTPNLIIGDADSGGYNRFSMDEVYGRTGLLEVARRHGVEVVNLSHLDRKKELIALGRGEAEVFLPKLLVEEIDFLLTMPVPKVHMYTGVSLCFKNQWGCIPEPEDRLRLHPHFSHAVLALNHRVKTRVAIIDGSFGLNRSGPLRGEAVELGWVGVADDPGSGERVACELMQVPLEKVPHLRLAEKQGLIPPLGAVVLNQDLRPFLKQPFAHRLAPADYPGLIAFRSPLMAHLAYFSPLSGILHKLLYLVREPFYDYGEHRLGGRHNR